ncbi:putative membrane protein YedE/YeeE [Cupriavidus alkaliphilus]|uniref:Putative membrane protein YedE/YeeE n=1 Tax=Cupriavidus alkaliphilus TaxID=942866 RepID=A0A7W4YU11_9BURK|nr:putative membrane protein YedE/YeeE [Cupriavidus alkaliphilus]
MRTDLLRIGLQAFEQCRHVEGLAGPWDPSLALVMVGAIAIGSLAFLIAKHRKHSFLGLPVQLPASTAVTLLLVLDSAAFGVGWGLAGFCPGRWLSEGRWLCGGNGCWHARDRGR